MYRHKERPAEGIKFFPGAGITGSCATLWVLELSLCSLKEQKMCLTNNELSFQPQGVGAYIMT